MRRLSRRKFLGKSVAAVASASLLPAVAAEQDPKRATAQSTAVARVVGANAAIGFAVVGFHGRGANHIEGMSAVKGTRMVALCDVDQQVLDREVQKCKNQGVQVAAYTDIRKLLEDRNVDVITIATPNHWHALASIWAVQAGKDVYVEKPVSHNVWEGRKIVEAARTHQRIVQAGMQIRSSSGIAEAVQFLREGHLGKILRARGLCYKRRESIGKVSGPQPVPSSVDYDLWCGPAPKEPLMRKRLHYDWHWIWPTGNGDLGNQGIHQMDVARWTLGEAALSPRVLSIGGRFGYEDDGTTPNTLITFHDYPAAPLIFEVRGLPSSTREHIMDDYRGAAIGVVVDCEGGSVVIPSYSKAIVCDKSGKGIKNFEGSSSHFANFIQAVRSRKHTDLKGDILDGHISSALCHTSNISYRLGQQRAPEAIREAIAGDKDMTETFGRMAEHLAANSVDTTKTPAVLGAVLTMDPQSERFIENPEADQLLTREYREPFVVREKV